MKPNIAPQSSNKVLYQFKASKIPASLTVFEDGSSARKSSAWKNCSTPFEQMHKYKKLLKKSHFEQMQVLDQNDQLLELQLLDKKIEKCQLLKFKKVEGLEHVW
jgi:hypothetical protein